MKTTTLYHPTIVGSTAEVSASSVDDWTEQGWKKSRPASWGDSDDAQPTAPQPAAKKATAKKATAKKAAPSQ